MQVFKSKIKLVCIIVSIVILIGGIFVYQRWQAKQESIGQKLIEQSTRQEEMDTSVIPPESVNWKTYRNEEWGFEFRYPSDWVVKEKTFGGYYSKFNVVFRPTTGRITQFPVLINIVLPEFVDASFKNIKKTTSETIVDGVPGIKYRYEFEGGQETAIILPFGEYKIILGTDNEQYIDIFDQVVATFVFLQ